MLKLGECILAIPGIPGKILRLFAKIVKVLFFYIAIHLDFVDIGEDEDTSGTPAAIKHNKSDHEYG